MKKKNKTMRAAGALFVATMLTTSMTAGTFAKYTTGDSASDSARVAKFGVVVQAQGGLFGNAYTKATNNGIVAYSTTENVTVKSGTENVKVVAPGTKNENGITISVSGKPEVATKLVFNYTNDDIKNIFLASGSYYDMTTTTTDDGFSFTGGNYEPVTYKLTVTDASDMTISALNDKKYTSISSLLDALNEALNDKVFAPGVDLASQVGTIKITWEWPFGSTDNDKKDTVLGDLASENPSVKKGTYSSGKITDPQALVLDTDYSLTAAINFSLNVEQVD